QEVIVYQRAMAEGLLLFLINFKRVATTITIDSPPKPWQLKLDSAAAEWNGPGSSLPQKITEAQSLELPSLSFALYSAA
ncbi:MAG: malto-oligosyltrehalose trehalohydrolase, partial [Nodosilinea sp.]